MWFALAGAALFVYFLIIVFGKTPNRNLRVSVALVAVAAIMAGGIVYLMVAGEGDEPACVAYGDCDYTELKR